MGIHNNYSKLRENNPQMAKHISKMYDLINEYAIKNNIKLAYDDRAEVLVEAIATYVVNSNNGKKLILKRRE